MNTTAIVDALGYPAAGLGILIESAGIPFPGEALLLAAAAWAAARHHSLALVILFGFTGAVVGANVGYYLGYRGGRPFVERFGSIFRIRPEHIARAELFFARHGDKAVLAARFVRGLRTWGSMLAGMARMPLIRFQVFSAIGALGWSPDDKTIATLPHNIWYSMGISSNASLAPLPCRFAARNGQ